MKKNIHQFTIIVIFIFFLLSLFPQSAIADITAYNECCKKCYNEWFEREAAGMSYEENNKILTSALIDCKSLLTEAERQAIEEADNTTTGTAVEVKTSGTSETDSSATQFIPNVTVGDKFIAGQGVDVTGTLLSEYIKAWYSFIIGAIGIFATVMIMYGGIKWLTSRGNSAAIGDAKEKIFSALIGLVLAFLSYTILYLINPNLVSLKTIDVSTVKPAEIKYDIFEAPGSHGSVTQRGTSTANPIPQLNSIKGQGNYENIYTFDRNKIPAKNPGVNFTAEQNAWFEEYGKQYGIDPDLLRAMCAAESSGNPGAISPAGAYGLMQILPETATTVALSDGELSGISELRDGSISGNELVNNPELSVQIAASFLSRNEEAGNLDIDDLIAGYNAGYSTKPGHALSQSSDCSITGVRAYRCAINPGGLVETQNYVYRVLSYFNYLKQ